MMRRALCTLLLAAVQLALGGCSARRDVPDASPGPAAASPVVSTEPAALSSPTVETDPLAEKWEACFFGGAEGQSESGEHVFLAYDELESMSAAALILLNAEGDEILNYVLGEVETEGDSRRILDVEEDVSLPFTILETEREDGFDLRFKDGDTAAMRIVDSDRIIADMLAIVHTLG